MAPSLDSVLTSVAIFRLIRPGIQDDRQKRQTDAGIV